MSDSVQAQAIRVMRGQLQVVRKGFDGLRDCIEMQGALGCIKEAEQLLAKEHERIVEAQADAANQGA